jgi:hypothetical protein
MNQVKLLLSLLIAATFFGGCKKDEIAKIDPITVSDGQSLSQNIFADDTQGKNVAFVTTGAWTSSITETTSGNWVSISPEHGSAAGSYTIVVSLVPNNTGENRSAAITISCLGQEITINITQSGLTEYGKLLATGVTIEPTSRILPIGDTVILATIVTPENADATVTWSSSAAEIATVSATGKITAISVGTAVITATTKGGNKTATCEVTVREPLPFTWTFDNGVLTISGDSGMPDAAPWGSLRSEITSVIINEGIKSVGKSAFSDCTGLTAVTIPNSVTHIQLSAFFKCIGLTAVTIPNSVRDIDHSAFAQCSSLTSVTIPNSVTSIGIWAFSNCTGLTSVTIPNSVRSIREKAFSNCSSLTSINVDIGNLNYSSEDGGLFDKNKYTLMQYPAGKTGNYTIPNSVISIEDGAFDGCAGLAAVIIPNSVTSIGNGAFAHCSGLTSLTIPNSVTSIGSTAFSSCTGLTAVTIPNSITSIEASVFAHCSGLTSVTIPNSITTIKEHAFYDCIGLTSLTIPNSVTSIGMLAFYGCIGLTSLTIPNSVTSIEASVFYGCTGLTSVTIPNSITNIKEHAFYGCTRLTAVTIPNSVKSIGETSFRNCMNLAAVHVSWSSPSEVTLGENVFFNVKSDAKLYVPSALLTAYQTSQWTTYFSAENIVGE